MHERSLLHIAGRPRVERTPNIKRMVVTLEVSKFSGWLNAGAICRTERTAYDARVGRREGGRRPRRKQRAGKSSTVDWGQATGRETYMFYVPNVEHVAHVCDLPRV